VLNHASTTKATVTVPSNVLPFSRAQG